MDLWTRRTRSQTKRTWIIKHNDSNSVENIFCALLLFFSLSLFYFVHCWCAVHSCNLIKSWKYRWTPTVGGLKFHIAWNIIESLNFMLKCMYHKILTATQIILSNKRVREWERSTSLKMSLVHIWILFNPFWYVDLTFHIFWAHCWINVTYIFYA